VKLEGMPRFQETHGDTLRFIITAAISTRHKQTTF
jgi:hypothetical protein